MGAIGVDQSLSNSALYEHRCLVNIKKLYKVAVKCEYQYRYKAIIGSALFSITKVCTDNSLMTPNSYVSTKNPSARKSLCQFTETLDVKHKTDVRKVGSSKANIKAIENSMCCSQTLQSAVVIEK